VVTSHASQGVTVDKVFVGVSSQSLPATYQRTAYVAVTRGKEQAQIFTDDKQELLKAISRPDDPMSAIEISDGYKQQQPQLRRRLMKQLAFAGDAALLGQRQHFTQPGGEIDGI
jgi:ATP-dependent exoDNAse (exonuclease V) alpha subunit